MTKWRPRFATPDNSESYYDLFYDWDLVESSFAQQYGIRLRREEEMSWGEFSSLLAGINGETPLGHVVSVRAEKDREAIKKFSPAERKIRSDWERRNRKVITNTEEYDKAMSGFASLFRSLSS